MSATNPWNEFGQGGAARRRLLADLCADLLALIEVHEQGGPKHGLALTEGLGRQVQAQLRDRCTAALERSPVGGPERERAETALASLAAAGFAALALPEQKLREAPGVPAAEGPRDSTLVVVSSGAWVECFWLSRIPVGKCELN